MKILPEKVISKFQAGPLPLTDPTSSAWLNLPAKDVKLITQDVQEPKLAQPSIRSLKVRSLNNGSWIAFHMEWEDATEDFNLRVDKYSDGVAIGLPINPQQPPDHRMGSEKEPIHLLLWKASQQKAKEGTSFLALNYPHRTSDYNPCELPGSSVSISPACAAEIKDLLPAVAAGNPIVPGTAPVVEELNAETYNKLMIQEDQHATGKGVWKDKHWYVVMARPIITPDPQDAPLDGGSSYVALACWDGNKGNQGPRKMVTEGWLGLEIGK
ncbi:MAG: ethylbenzene dehydrogenase-related protein [Candidatus Brocadiales bacterium]